MPLPASARKARFYRSHHRAALSVSSRGAAFLFPAFPVSNATAYADLTGLVEKELIEREGRFIG
jgi:hypothetical protein